MADQQDTQIGKMLGDYQLVRRLGGGSFGIVYLAMSRQQAPVAIKILYAQFNQPEDFKDFINEARMMRLQHPHIMPVLDFGISRENVPYLVMEYAPGGTLSSRHPRGKQLTLPTILTYVEQLASALQYAHERRIVHRDVKPENGLLRADGTLLLSDFGIAKVLEINSLVSSSVTRGTPAYMAPEQSQGKPVPATDQYALAAMVYEWIAGRLPFQGSILEVAMQHRKSMPLSLVTLRPDLPLAVEQVVFTALTKDPAARFASVQEFAAALRRVLDPDATLIRQKPGGQIAHSVPPRPTSPVGSIHETQATSARPVPARASQAPPTAKIASTTGSAYNTHTLPTRDRSFAGSKTPRRARPWWVLGSLALLIIIVSVSIEAFFLIQNHSQSASRSNATATLQETAPGTAPAQNVPTALATAAANAYNTAVIKDGIQFGFDAAHTGYNPYEQLLSPTTVPHLKQAWSASMGGGDAALPVVANGVVYVGSDIGILYAFNANGCTQPPCDPLWQTSIGSKIDGSPAVVNGVIYLGATNGKLYAFDTECTQSCNPLWTATTGGEIDGSPTVADGVVYLGSLDHKLYTFNAAGCGQLSCNPLWTATTGDKIDTSPVVANGMVYVSSQDSNLYAFKSAGCGQPTCVPLWTATSGADFSFGTPAVADGIVYVGSLSGSLYTFNGSGCGQPTCNPLWTTLTGGLLYAAPAIANGMVYFGSDEGKFYAFHASGCGQDSCNPLWTGSARAGSYSAPTVANGVVYLGSNNGLLYAFPAAGCSQASCDPLLSVADPAGSQPVVANGVVYLGPRITAFHL